LQRKSLLKEKLETLRKLFLWIWNKLNSSYATFKACSLLKSWDEPIAKRHHQFKRTGPSQSLHRIGERCL